MRVCAVTHDDASTYMVARLHRVRETSPSYRRIHHVAPNTMETAALRKNMRDTALSLGNTHPLKTQSYLVLDR